jgi:hypothetical protein
MADIPKQMAARTNRNNFFMIFLIGSKVVAQKRRPHIENIQNRFRISAGGDNAGFFIILGA